MTFEVSINNDLGNFSCVLSSADYFFRNTIRVSNSLDPDQDKVGPDLGPNCL